MNNITPATSPPWGSVITLFAVNCIYQPAAVAVIFYAGITHECLTKGCGYGIFVAPVIGLGALIVATGAAWGTFVVCRGWPDPNARSVVQINLALTLVLPFILFVLAMYWLHMRPAYLEPSHGPLWG